MRPLDIAVIGDRFMLAEVFREEIERLAPAGSTVRALELPWPDEPMHHGYSGERAGQGLEALREYFGDPETVADFIGDAQVFVTHLAPVSGPMIARLKRLELIAVSRGGPVNIDAAAVRAAGIKLVNTPGRNASAVAEFTIGAILSESRLIRAGHEALRQGDWRGDLYRADTTGTELSEQVVGIVGYGQIGARVVKLLKAFGCRLLVADPYVQISAADRADGVEQVSLEKLLAEADIVTLHARVTPETAKFMNADAFGAMKRGAIFVNTARGPLVDYDALYHALTSGHLRGAMLETFAIEPPPADWPLLKLPNVTLTPHIAGASTTTVRIAAAMIAEEVRRHAGGEGALNPVA